MMKHARRHDGEHGSAMIIVLLVITLLLLLGAGLLATSGTELAIAANDHWAEGSFQAAEAAVQVAVDQLAVDNTDQVVALTDIGEAFAFRSGGREDTTPQPPELVGTAAAAGFGVDESTGYGSTGYRFAIYSITGTGSGPRSTEREVEVQVLLGPVTD